MHRDRRRRPRDGLAPPRQLVEAPAADVLRREGRRHLVEGAHEAGEGRGERRRRRVRGNGRAQRLARQVVGRGGEAEPHGRHVLLLAPGQEAGEARGAADADRQDAGRERVERARVPDPPGPERAAHAVDDVVRGRARRLVHDQDAVHGAATPRFRRPRPRRAASPAPPPPARSRATRSVASSPLS